MSSYLELGGTHVKGYIVSILLSKLWFPSDFILHYSMLYYIYVYI